MRNAVIEAALASASSSWKYLSNSLIGVPPMPIATCRLASVQPQRGLDVAHHRHQARPEVVFQLPLLHHERRHDAVEGDELAVDPAAHRHAHRVHLPAHLALGGAEAS